MKVVCINSGQVKGGGNASNSLTTGKVYETLDDLESITTSCTYVNSQYCVLGDSGHKYAYMKERFMPIYIIRENKLKILLGE